MILTSMEGQNNLPRYFAQVFDVAQSLENGQLDLALDDGRTFRAEGRHPGPVAVIEVHNPDLFARLIREGDLGWHCCKDWLSGTEGLRTAPAGASVT